MKISSLCLLLLFFSGATMLAQKTPSAIDSLLFGQQAVVKIPKSQHIYVLPGGTARVQDSLRLQNLNPDPLSFRAFDLLISDDFTESGTQDTSHKMPVYDFNGKFVMPIQTIDSTKTYSLRIYGSKKDFQ